MNAAVAILVCLLLLAFGARFFARFLGIAVFRVDPVSVPRPGLLEIASAFATPGGAIVGSTTLLGASLAAGWGWGPALIWIMAGTLLVGGVYSMGVWWLARQYPAQAFSEIVARLLGPKAPTVLLGVLLIALLTLAPVLALSIGELLASWSVSASALLGITVLAACIAACRGMLTLAVSAIAIPGIIWAAWQWPLRLNGYIGIDLGEFDLTIQNRAIWILAATGLAILLTIRPATARQLSRFAIALLALMITALVIALIFSHPNVVAPAVNAGGNFGPVMPLLAVTLTGGAIAVFHGFASDGDSPVDASAAAPGIAYGRAVFDGLVAVVVVIVISTAFPNTEDWFALSSTVPSDRPLPLWLSGTAIMSAQRLAEIGLPHELMSALTVLVIATLALVALERTVFIADYLIGECEIRITGRNTPPGVRIGAVAVITIAGALFLRDVPVGLALWPLVGAACQVFAATLLGCIGIALMDHGRRATVVIAAAILLMTAALGASVHALASGALTQFTPIAAGHILISMAAVWLGFRLSGALRERRTILSSITPIA